MRELVGEYIVEMYPANGRVYYTVTRKGTAELLAIGHEPTTEEALEQAKWGDQRVRVKRLKRAIRLDGSAKKESRRQSSATSILGQPAW